MSSNAKYICWDLVPSIIQYVRPKYLIILSSVCPMFDVEIFRAGIRMFYDIYEFRLLKKEDIIIQLASGRKCVVDTLRVKMQRINVYEKYYDLGFRLEHDNDSRIGIHIKPDVIYVFKNFINNDWHHFARIHGCITEKISCIDFETKVAMTFCIGYREYAIESFEILFDGVRWNH